MNTITKAILVPTTMAVAGILSIATFSICTDSANGQDSSATKVMGMLPVSQWKLPQELSFCGERIPLNIPEVRERAEREFYVNLQTPGQIILYIKRSGRYFSMFEKVLKDAKAPDDLKYLSVAESALYMARSPKDAVGLWQFIPATARAQGLVVTDDIDERRNPVRSTRAAIAYLQSGYDSNGTWTNAAAGYNMGHGSFANTMSYQGGRQFYDLFLNEETSRYILRIAVIKHLMENAAYYGIVIPKSELYKDPAMKIIQVRSTISDVAAWAASQGTTYKDVKLLNPWILGRTVPAPPSGRTWEIQIPA